MSIEAARIHDLPSAMTGTLDDIIDFVTTPAFRAVVDELNDQPASAWPDFVESVLLDDAELERRGVTVPEDVLIQRSSFGDGRPTLFCVVKYLPEEYRDLWAKMTVTFDRGHDWADYPAGADAWKEPAHSALLAARMAASSPGERLAS